MNTLRTSNARSYKWVPESHGEIIIELFLYIASSLKSEDNHLMPLFRGQGMKSLAQAATPMPLPMPAIFL